MTVNMCIWNKNSCECLFSQTVFNQLSRWCLYRLGWCARDWTTRATSATGATAVGRRSAAAITMNCGVSILPPLQHSSSSSFSLFSRSGLIAVQLYCTHTHTLCILNYSIIYPSKITCLIGCSYFLLALQARRTCAVSGNRLLPCNNNYVTQTECVSSELFALRLTNQNDMRVQWPLPHTAGWVLEYAGWGAWVTGYSW